MSKSEGALRNAANNGELARVRELLAQGADPNQPNGLGDTALLLAANNGHTEIVRVLLENHANPSIHGYGRITPLAAAIHRNDEAIVDLLLTSSIRNSPPQLREGLGGAIASASPRLVRRLLAAGASPTELSSSGHNALAAAHECQRDSVEPYRSRFDEIIAILQDHIASDQP